MLNPFIRLPEPLILASSSPRRAALLREIGVEFRVVEPQVSEAADPAWGPAEHAVALARRKAREVAGGAGAGVVLGADTLVVSEGRVLGKPRSEGEARDMLRVLSGRTHEVLTGLVMIRCSPRREVADVSRTLVTMRRMSGAEIDAYVATGEPMDKAGAYGIQGSIAPAIDRIEGCYFNVVGLPLALLAQLAAQVSEAGA